jgi:ATP-binding cassette subfamily F protein 3
LAHLLLNPSNTLILDEPTNHLDIRAKEVLKEAIAKYPGTVIVVSHDRDFLIGMTNKVFEFNEGIVTEFVGDVNDFFEERRLANFREVELQEENTDKKSAKETNNSKTTSSNSNQDKATKNKISKLEEEISIKEFDIKKLEDKIETLSEEGKYEPTIVEQLGTEKKALELLLQNWEQLQS